MKRGALMWLATAVAFAAPTLAGATFYLAPGKWDEQTHSISWEAPAASPVSHKTRCTFVDERTRSCETIVKDWKGSVLLEQGYTAVRR